MTEQLQSIDDAWSLEGAARSNELVLPLEGEMTVGRARELKPVILAALATLTPGTCLRLDLAGVSELDTSGVQLLLLAHELTAARAASLRLMPVSAAVQQVLAFLNLSEAFEISPSELS